jgi:hypothetical protein
MTDVFSSVERPSAKYGSMDMGQQSLGSLFASDPGYSAFDGPRFSMHKHAPSALDRIRSQIWDFDLGSEANKNYRYIVKVDRLDIT